MSVHLMNMEADGKSVLVTFARKGSEAQAFDPVVNGKWSRFTLAGNGKMTDSATKSTWDAITGECLAGVMKGAHLTERPDKVTYRESRIMINASDIITLGSVNVFRSNRTFRIVPAHQLDPDLCGVSRSKYLRTPNRFVG